MQKKQSVMNDRKTMALLALTILWMGVVFYFSSQPADKSAYVSGYVTKELLRLSDRLSGGHTPQFISGFILGTDHLVRKFGHVFEYIILGGLVISFVRRLGTRKRFMAALLICMLYAASDEIHQMFVPGRGPLVTDAMLDSVSSAAGISLVTLWAWLRARRLKAGGQ